MHVNLFPDLDQKNYILSEEIIHDSVNQMLRHIVLREAGTH